MVIGYNPITKSFDKLKSEDFFDKIGRVERDGQTKSLIRKKQKSHKTIGTGISGCRIFWPWEDNA